MAEFREEGMRGKLIRHCDMYLYWSRALWSPESQDSPAYQFHLFGGMQLVSVMFLLEGNGGLFGRALQRANRMDILDGVNAVLRRDLGGGLERGAYLASKRNKLATHSFMAVKTQPENVQNLTFNDNQLGRFDEAMNDLEDAVQRLRTLLFSADLAL